jgi:hypothetical protein
MMKIVNIIENDIIVNRIVIDENTELHDLVIVEDPKDSYYNIGDVFDATTNTFITPAPNVTYIIEAENLADIAQQLEEIINKL